MSFRPTNYAVAAVLGLASGAQAAIDRVPEPVPDIDFSAISMRDDAGAAILAAEEGNDKSDLRIARALREAINDDKVLASLGQNIRIESRNGEVTLRGPVNNDAQRLRLAQLALNTAGVTGVNNELDVKRR